MHPKRLYNNLHKVRSNSKVGKPNNFKVLGARKPKELNRIAKPANVTYAWGKITLVLIIITLRRV
jgi:hypothetical protein